MPFRHSKKQQARDLRTSIDNQKARLRVEFAQYAGRTTYLKAMLQHRLREQESLGQKVAFFVIQATKEYLNEIEIELQTPIVAEVEVDASGSMYFFTPIEEVGLFRSEGFDGKGFPPSRGLSVSEARNEWFGRYPHLMRRGGGYPSPPISGSTMLGLALLDCSYVWAPGSEHLEEAEAIFRGNLEKSGRTDFLTTAYLASTLVKRWKFAEAETMCTELLAVIEAAVIESDEGPHVRNRRGLIWVGGSVMTELTEYVKGILVFASQMDTSACGLI